MRHVLCVGLLALAGCMSSPRAEVSEPSTSPVSRPTVEATTSETSSPVWVPDMVGSRLREVRRTLEQQGLEIDVRDRPMCPPGVVVRQEPVAGTKVDPAATVLLVVSDSTTLSCAVSQAPESALALRDWAAGQGPVPSLADEVHVMQGNRVALTLSAAEAEDPARWTMPAGYAERIALNVITDLLSKGPPLRESALPPFGCLDHGALADGLVRRLWQSWSLVTPEGDSCMQLAAVQVWVDDEGRITDVNLLMGSP